ncbi:MAG: polyprenol monophosphomannose synthase [Planctomycetota bacterium]
MTEAQGGTAPRSEPDAERGGSLFAHPGPRSTTRGPVLVIGADRDVPLVPPRGAAYAVTSFDLVDALVRRGVDSSRVVVLEADATEADAERLAGGEPDVVLQPKRPHRFPGRDLVVVPTYNERENLPRLLDRIPGHLVCDVLVVDDGSPDGTGDLADTIAKAQPWVHVLHRSKKEGLGKAYIAGFRWALERDYERIYEMDADFSHAPNDLPRLAHAAQSADLVIGSRYVKGGDTTGWSFRRRLLSRCGNLYARMWLGFGVNDWTAGFRCMRADALRKIDLDAVGTDGYAFQIEMAWRFRRAGLRVAEVPVHFVDRNVGKSKMSAHIALEAVRKVPGLRLRV